MLAILCRLLTAKLSHLGAEDAHTLHVALLTADAHELCAYADAQDGLREGGDEGVESALGKLGHGGRGFAHTGQYHLVGSGYDGLVVRIYPVGTSHAS